ncbi:ABC transporter substrate-binding protein [Amycolatopsis pigmentata]|uniref:ABC transporter substrate-binding protein n=1 Tax=Amycolatopsis pigmentata TaxID=450801 RepID=A0ABW5FLQ6_9PSEU
MLLVAGCSSGANTNGSNGGSLVSGGTLRVGAEEDEVPMVYTQAGSSTPVGAEVDLITAAAKQLNLTVSYSNLTFDGLIPALKAGRFDVAMAEIGDFTDRQQQVDFVDYATIGQGALVNSASAASFTDDLALCGKNVGAAKGTKGVAVVTDISKKCQSSGKPAVNPSSFPDVTSAVLALRSGRVDAFVTDTITAGQEAKSVDDGKALSVALPNLNGQVLLGIAVPKSNQPLRDGLAKALNALIANGEYAQILDRYGQSGIAVKNATINGGTTASS